MSFVEHLSELRLRLRTAALVFVVAVLVSFFFVKRYFEVLTRPARAAWMDALHGSGVKFIFISPTEPFWVYTKLAMYGALLLASPFIFWELWKFVAPGPLPQREADGDARHAGDRLLLHRRRPVRLLGAVQAGADLHVLVRRGLPGDLPFKIEPAVIDERARRFHAGDAARHRRRLRAAGDPGGARLDGDRHVAGSAASSTSTRWSCRRWWAAS